MAIGLIGIAPGKRMRLQKRNPNHATGHKGIYAGDANRKANLAEKQRVISLYGGSSKEAVING